MSGATGPALPAADRRKLASMIGLLASDVPGERDAALAAATRLLDRHGMRWCQLLDLPPQRGQQAAPRRSWQATRAALLDRRGSLRPWEVGFLVGLARFHRISRRQRSVLIEIAERVLGSAGK